MLAMNTEGGNSDVNVNIRDNIQHSPTWKSVKTLTPLFLIAGIYQKDPSRSRGLDILAKVYCGFVLVLVLLNCCFYLLDTIGSAMRFICSGYLIAQIIFLLSWIYIFIMVIAWTHINWHIKYYCSVVDNVFDGHEVSTAPKIMKILKVVAWMWCLISMLNCILFVSGGIGSIEREPNGEQIIYVGPLLYEVKAVLQKASLFYAWYAWLPPQLVFNFMCYSTF